MLALLAFVVVMTVMGMGDAWRWGVPAEVGYAAMAVVGMAQVLLTLVRHCTTWVPEAHMWWLSTTFTTLQPIFLVMSTSANRAALPITTAIYVGAAVLSG